jgi:modulator of FtsH protease HflK
VDRQPGGPKGDINWEEVWQKIAGNKSSNDITKYLKKGPVVWIIAGVIIAIWLLTGIYTVGPGEVGVVRQFGSHVSTASPGLNYHLPWPIQSYNRVNMEEIRVAEVGFRTVSAGQFQIVKVESQMLTGDENIVDAQVVVQYKVRDAADYLFNVEDPEEALSAATEVALRGVVGSNTIDFVMIDGRSIVQSETMEFLQRLLDAYGSGLQITALKLQSAGPPQEVKDSFDEVVRAREDREKVVRDAEGYAADKVPVARGEAEQLVLAATAYKEQRVLKAEGDASKFLNILREHEVPAAFQSLADYGNSEALQALIQIGTIDGESATMTRDKLYEILKGYGVAGGVDQPDRMTGVYLNNAFAQLGIAGEYQNAYEEAIRLTEERLYLETMEDVLTGTEKFIVDPDTGGNLVPFLPLKELTTSGQTQEATQ